jgi:hypothetical protein
MLPDFVIIGAQKAGTSSVYAWLCENPYVRGARRKEVHFFTHHHHRGPDWYRRQFPSDRDRAAFAAGHGRPFITGEATPAYLLAPRVPGLMARLIPDVKLIVQLRDPVERAYSQFQMNRRLGLEPIASFSAALALEDPRFADGCDPSIPERDWGPRSWTHYLGRGRYAEQLQRWFTHFPAERFHVLTMEALAAQPEETLDRLRAFLGLPPHIDPRPKPVTRGSYGPMPADVRAGLRAYFTPHNERLYELLGRDFGWERTAPLAAPR